MNDSTSNLPIQNNDDVADIVLQEMKRIPLLRFHNSTYDIGPDEVPPGTEYHSYPLDGHWGWVLFEDGKLIDQRMGPFSDGTIAKPD
jgi:hypothetical protein